MEDISRATVGKFRNRLQALSICYRIPIPEANIDLLPFDVIDIIRPKLDWFMEKITSSPTTD